MRFSLIRQAVISSLLLACFILPRELIAESFNVTIDTTPLNGVSGVLAFDFIDGDVLNNNTITITNFTTDGILGTSSTSGDVTGTLDSGLVNIGDADFFNELLQDITYGSFITFNIDITVNGPFSPFPDAFSFFLLDSGLLPFPTSDPLGADALFILEINSINPMPVEFNSSFASVMIISDKSEEVDIDIKPGSDPNSINPRSRGVIAVAILTTEDFDATTVDPLSVEFGPNGATEAHNRGHIEDVDGDGDNDMVLHFRTEETGIQCGDTSVSLTGETFDGQEIEGSDSIITVGCQ